VTRVLLAEDSAVVREHLVHLIEEDEALSVVATAVDGEEAVRLAERLRPDVIVLDIHMPRMNGYDAARSIMERAPAPIVMATASSNRSDTRHAFDALACGALVLIEKPVGLDHPRAAEAGRELIRTVRLMSEVKVVRRWPARTPAVRAAAGRRPPPRVIAIGASTGGPAVLADLLKAVPSPLGVPILIVQHISPGFTEAFAEWLSSAAKRAVKLAESGERARPDTVYVAPPGKHMGIAGSGRIVLGTRRGPNGFCPSASHLFGSVADAFGARATGVVLTGMGRDGAEGLCRLRKAGGLTIAQDEATSVVFGMPGAAIESGAAELVLPPDRIVSTIRSLTRELG
jgi:two-component system, chemotaxis family, protein-glutamate methylesterase/glutaminase